MALTSSIGGASVGWGTGMMVLRGACYPDDWRPPLDPWARVVEQLLEGDRGVAREALVGREVRGEDVGGVRRGVVAGPFLQVVLGGVEGEQAVVARLRGLEATVVVAHRDAGAVDLRQHLDRGLHDLAQGVVEVAGAQRLPEPVHAVEQGLGSGVLAAVLGHAGHGSPSSSGADPVPRLTPRRGTGCACIRARSIALSSRSMPVIAATRAERRASTCCCPSTPALRRCHDTICATPAATTTPTTPGRSWKSRPPFPAIRARARRA